MIAIIKPAQRVRILMRDGRCVLCGSRRKLHVAHIITVPLGLKHGLTETELNDDENLCVHCEECELAAGAGYPPIPFWIVLPILRLRLRKNRGAL